MMGTELQLQYSTRTSLVCHREGSKCALCLLAAMEAKFVLLPSLPAVLGKGGGPVLQSQKN